MARLLALRLRKHRALPRHCEYGPVNYCASRLAFFEGMPHFMQLRLRMGSAVLPDVKPLNLLAQDPAAYAGMSRATSVSLPESIS